MPAEIGFAILVILAVGWVIVALLGAVIKVVSNSRQAVDGSLSDWSYQRLQRQKATLRQYTWIALPDELAGANDQFSQAQKAFSLHKAKAARTPDSPKWERAPFLKQIFSPQRATYLQMDVAQIDGILKTEPIRWAEKESKIIAQRCAYPVPPPISNIQEYRHFEIKQIELREAIFEISPNAPKIKKINELFRDERKKVAQYNERRLVILSRYADLTRAIRNWNAQEQERWNTYANLSKRNAQEAVQRHLAEALEYTNECKRQQAKHEKMLQGYRNCKREDVIARIECILGTLSVPSSIPRIWSIDYDEVEKILIVEIGLPDIVHHPPIKTVQLKKGNSLRPLSQFERRELVLKSTLRSCYGLHTKSSKTMIPQQFAS